ncbi:YeeE/YedE thiosulfate transporter family protein [Anaeromyxobacter terrae]|uniref:YeeE/YedE thiosulfate transporter family protein n=1 Tax=Anaeromyxobacter terrae TaxID=2925406 RepID=UPI001F56E3C2|nr:YeeE/YedE thiosulfate transporter family protein [Anaeromyxobacter sp. SG22]
MTTIFPIEALSDERRALGMAVAVVVGIGFGFVLERSGFGRAQKLVGQFYGYDFTVLKVMFTAIVTAMLGLVVLSSAGVVDLAAIQFNYPTYLWPMIVGGLLLGAGFVMSGYCPGTSLVATASGKLDGVSTVLGVVAGGLVYAHVEPALGAFPNSGKLGALSLSAWLGLPAPIVAAFVVAIAIAAFLAGERIERMVAGAAEAVAPTGAARKWIFVGLVAVALAGVAMLALPTGTSAAP